ncbi:2TM domain-containing protein [Flavobacterium sp.]
MEVIMENYNEEYERYQRAKKHVEEIRGFYANLIAYFVVNIFLMYINLRYSPQYLWFLWSAGGWGIGLLFHAMKLFNFAPFLGKDWEERKLKEFMEEEKKRKYE